MEPSQQPEGSLSHRDSWAVFQMRMWTGASWPGSHGRQPRAGIDHRSVLSEQKLCPAQRDWTSRQQLPDMCCYLSDLFPFLDDNPEGLVWPNISYKRGQRNNNCVFLVPSHRVLK